jgi:catechol 2,3-dioxygenase
VAERGRSAYLRGWRDYERYSLKVTESPTPGLGHVAFRTVSAQALDDAVSALEAAGFEGAWVEEDEGQGPAYALRNGDGHAFELYYQSEHYAPPADAASVYKNQASRSPARGAAVERIDHLNLASADVRASREFAEHHLGFKLSERLLTPDGDELGAWLRVTSKAYDLTYIADPAHASNRLHHVAFRVESREDVLRTADILTEHGCFIELGPAKHDIGGTFFVYAYEPSGNRIEVCAGGYLIFAPDWTPATWTLAPGDRFQAWNTPIVDSFFAYATPDVSGSG